MTISRRGLALTTLLGLLLLAGCGSRSPERDPRVHSDGTTVRVSLDDVGVKGDAFFTYMASSDRRVDFLIYRESTGTYRAVLDACRKCYRWRKGYLLQEGTVVCRKCGETYDVDSLREGRGSCIPIPLTSSLEGKVLAIPVAELETGAKYF